MFFRLYELNNMYNFNYKYKNIWTKRSNSWFVSSYEVLLIIKIQRIIHTFLIATISNRVRTYTHDLSINSIGNASKYWGGGVITESVNIFLYPVFNINKEGSSAWLPSLGGVIARLCRTFHWVHKDTCRKKISACMIYFIQDAY